MSEPYGNAFLHRDHDDVVTVVSADDVIGVCTELWDDAGPEHRPDDTTLVLDTAGLWRYRLTGRTTENGHEILIFQRVDATMTGMTTPDLADLLTALYAIHPTGGPLHVAVDDGNLDGVIVPHYKGWSAADLDALYDGGWPIADLPPEAPAVVEGLGRSTRQICDELAALLNAMPVAGRYAAVARFHGHLGGDAP